VLPSFTGCGELGLGHRLARRQLEDAGDDRDAAVGDLGGDADLITPFIVGEEVALGAAGGDHQAAVPGGDPLADDPVEMECLLGEVRRVVLEGEGAQRTHRPDELLPSIDALDRHHALRPVSRCLTWGIVRP